MAPMEEGQGDTCRLERHESQKEKEEATSQKTRANEKDHSSKLTHEVPLKDEPSSPHLSVNHRDAAFTDNNMSTSRDKDDNNDEGTETSHLVWDTLEDGEEAKEEPLRDNLLWSGKSVEVLKRLFVEDDPPDNTHAIGITYEEEDHGKDVTENVPESEESTITVGNADSGDVRAHDPMELHEMEDDDTSHEPRKSDMKTADAMEGVSRDRSTTIEESDDGTTNDRDDTDDIDEDDEAPITHLGQREDVPHECDNEGHEVDDDAVIPYATDAMGEGNTPESLNDVNIEHDIDDASASDVEGTDHPESGVSDHVEDAWVAILKVSMRVENGHENTAKDL